MDYVWTWTGVAILVLAAGGFLLLRRRPPESAANYPPGPNRQVPFFGDWHAIGDRITARRLADLSEKYGNIFLLRMGRRKIVVLNSPELAHEMLVKQGLSFASRATNLVLDVFVGGGTRDLAFAVYGDHWRKARRITTLPFFTKEAARRWAPTWAAEADAMIDSLGGGAGGHVTTLRPHVQLMMYNNLYQMTFGRRFLGLDDALYDRIRHLNDQRGRLVQSLDYNFADFNAVFLPLVWPYLLTCYYVKHARHRLFRRFIQEYLDKRSSHASREIYGIEHLLKALESNELKMDNVLYILENINAAGIPTMLATIEWTLAELVRNPQIQTKLYNEIKHVDEIDKETLAIQVTDSKLFPYLNAVVKETMRYHTIVPLIVPHMNLEPSTIAGYDISANTRVLVNAWWLANNPKWWDKPNVFNPQRFLEVEEHVEMKGNNFKFLLFGSGRRQCPGITIALPVVLTTIAKLLLKFEVCPPTTISNIDMTEMQGQFLLDMKTPLRVLLKERNNEIN